MSKIAVRFGEEHITPQGAVRRAYRLSEPLEGHDVVVVSALPSAYDTKRPETYIFGADDNGKITHWGELAGSYRGGTDHNEALRGAGYEVSE